jgi:hypothetical protein
MGDDGRGGSGVGGWRRVRHSGKSRSEASERQVDVEGEGLRPVRIRPNPLSFAAAKTSGRL